MHGSETQPRAFLLRREKRKKYFIEVLFRNPFPGVLKRNFDDVAFSAADIDVAAARRNRQLPSFRHRFKRVRRHIPEDLPELILIDQGHERAGRQGRNNSDARTCSRFMLNEIERLSKYFVEVVLCEIERWRAGLLKEFSYDIVEPGGLPNRNVH